MELIIYRDIQAESIGLIRQKVEKHGEEYHYIQISSVISGRVFPSYSEAIKYYENEFIQIKKALIAMGNGFQVL